MANTKYKPRNRKKMVHSAPKIYNAVELWETMERHGDRLAYRYFEDSKLCEMSYAQFRTMIREAAAAFTDMGLVGEKVAIIGDNSPQWLGTYVAALAAGCIVVPMDKELDVEEVRGFFAMVDARAVVYSKTFNTKFQKSIEEGDTSIRYFIPINPAEEGDKENLVTYADMLARGREKIAADGYDFPREIDHEAMAEMLFTSGTTGTSKCVMLSQKNVFATVNSALETVCFTPDDVIVSVLPVHHTYELMCLLAEMILGMETCINDSLRRATKNFQRFSPTGLVLVPLFINTMHKAIWTQAEQKGMAAKLRFGLKLSRFCLRFGIDIRRKIFKSVHDAFGGRLDHIICGGARLNPEMIAAFEDFGISIFEGFGITECSPLAAVTPYYARKYGSVGRAVPCCEIRISEDFSDGTVNADGYVEGEIHVRGDNVMLGYYKNPEANAAVFTEDGWFRTGDVGYMDKDGYVYITGRCKSVIVLENGKNVFPEEIEEGLEALDTINEVVVVGRKAEDNETVMLVAVVYPEYSKFPEGTDEETIKETIRKSINEINRNMPSFKQVKGVEIRSTEFEKTPSRKIKRFLVK